MAVKLSAPTGPYKIVIVGAGPGGLTLAVLLHRAGVPFTIFEFRPQPTEQELDRPAGSLDLHEESGLAAIRACGLYDEFMALTGDCTEGQKIADKYGNVLHEDTGEGSNRPEISRHKIIKLLLNQLPPSAFKWNHKLVSASRVSDPARTYIQLDFGANGTYACDLVIGADGAWSKVRGLLTDTKPKYAGMQTINLDIMDLTQHPRLAELAGPGTFAALGNRHGIAAQHSVRDSARIYVFLTTNDEHYATSTGLAGKTAAEAKTQLLGHGSPFFDWGEDVKRLVAAACDDLSAEDPQAVLDIKPLHKLPPGHNWPHRTDATLIGDAAHLMNPPAGEGVNIAMQDSLMLSSAIIKAHVDGKSDVGAIQSTLEPLMRDFEVDMSNRATEMAEGTLEVNKIMFGTDEAAKTMSDWFKSFR